MLTRRSAHPAEGGPPERGLVGNAGSLLGSRLVQAGLAWCGTVLIAQSLSTEQFGQFTLIFTVLGLMSIVTDMGIGRLAVRGMLDGDPEEQAHFAGAYLVLRSLLGLVGYMVALLVLVIGGYSRDLVEATAVAGLVVILATPSAALDVVFQSRMRMGITGHMTTLGILSQVALTAALAAAGGSVLLFTIPAVLAELVILAWKVPAALRLLPFRPRVDLVLWRRLIREALPLTAGFGLAAVYTRVDVVMLSQLATFEDVGTYGVSYKFIDVMHFISTAVTVPLLTLLVTSWPHDPAGFRLAVRRGAMLLGLFGGVALTGLLGFAGPLTALLYGDAYAVGADATQLLALAEMLGFATTLAMSCLVAVGRHRSYPLVMLLGLAVNISLNLVLIPRLTYEGAALATLATNLLLVVIMWALLLRLPEMRRPGLARLLALPVAVAAGVGAGIAARLVLPWWLAAAAATLVYVAVATLLGLTSAAGLSVRRLLAHVSPGSPGPIP